MTFHQSLLVLWRELRPVDRQCNFVDRAVEGERNLVIPIIDASERVGAYVKALVELEDDGDRVLHLLLGYDLTIHLERPGATAPDARRAAEGECPKAQTIILEIEL